MRTCACVRGVMWSNVQNDTPPPPSPRPGGRIFRYRLSVRLAPPSNQNGRPSDRFNVRLAPASLCSRNLGPKRVFYPKQRRGANHRQFRGLCWSLLGSESAHNQRFHGSVVGWSGGIRAYLYYVIQYSICNYKLLLFQRSKMMEYRPMVTNNDF